MNDNAESFKKMISECIDGRELADTLDVCRETVIRWGDRKKIPYLSIGSKRVYHVPSVLEAMQE